MRRVASTPAAHKAKHDKCIADLRRQATGEKYLINPKKSLR